MRGLAGRRPSRVVRAPAAALVLFVFLAAVAPSLADETAVDPPPGWVSETLSNGLRVSILAEPGNPVVATQLWYHVGSANEESDSRGLAHLFEHMMFGKTANHDEQDYWTYHHIHGGDNNAYTTPDETVYVSSIPPGAHLGVLELEADRTRNLVIDRDNLENEKKIVTEELRLRTENDPYARVLVAAQKALLGEHPYAFDPSGSKEDVAAATVKSCRAFYDAYYRPNNAHLVIVGPVDVDETLEAVRRHFGPIPSGGKAPEEVPPLLGWSYPPEVVLEEDLPPAETAILAFPLPPAGSKDHLALELLEQLLAGGRIDPFREEIVVRRRKALEAGTYFLKFRRGGAAVFYSAALPYRRKTTAYRLMDEARARLSELDWLSEESLESAKRSLRRHKLQEPFFSDWRAGSIGRAEWWMGDATLAFDEASRIESVRLDEVAAAYRKYIGEPEPVRLYIKPESVPLLVRLFGWVYPLVSR